jgi:aminoglycoside 6'-N-acetyltransferase I
MKIRKATKKDIPEMGNLIKKEFAKSPYKEKWSKTSLNKTLKDFFNSGYAILATDSKNIIGLIILKEQEYCDGKWMVIEELVVDGKFQGRGIGRKLIEEIENISKKGKFSQIYLSTHKGSKAFQFYKRLGYKESKKTVFMRKILK